MSEQNEEQLQIVRSCPFAPPAQHLRLQSENPVARVEFPTGQAAWVATRYDDIRAILNDTRFSSDRRHPGSPQVAAQVQD
jgi:cytochrome P450